MEFLAHNEISLMSKSSDKPVPNPADLPFDRGKVTDYPDLMVPAAKDTGPNATGCHSDFLAEIAGESKFLRPSTRQRKHTSSSRLSGVLIARGQSFITSEEYQRELGSLQPPEKDAAELSSSKRSAARIQPFIALGDVTSCRC